MTWGDKAALAVFIAMVICALLNLNSRVNKLEEKEKGDKER